MKTVKKKIGIIGLGSVGWALIHALSPHYEYVGYDIAGSYSFSRILDTGIIFICVPTPLSSGNRLDCSSVDDVLHRLNEAGYRQCIVVKSTLGNGFMDAAARRYPDLRLVYMPEFLRERSAFSWSCDPDRLVVSGTETDMTEVLSYFSWVSPLIPRLRMSWQSAILGKLAHNAYIATKVSFTNEIEQLSRDQHADPSAVMQVVWTDRRVGNPEHLTPFMGGYGGKCVPKDTCELAHCGRPVILLDAVEQVNAQQPSPGCAQEDLVIVTIIPTKGRIDLLKNGALKSLANQRQKPDKIYLVCDRDDCSAEDLRKIVVEFSPALQILIVQNTAHRQNLSGAVNAGLEQASKDFAGSAKVFAALLDDDDWWDMSYLQNLKKYEAETHADWIISGLIRHDAEHPDGYHQTIPQSVDTDMFYVTNPNIQGSNLFVRLSCLCAIGGFDELLVSTTDRDVCIRLLKAKTTYAVLNNHLVHHNALDDHDRLSHPGNERKRAGLTAFYRKYSPEMSEDQQRAFRERAASLFAISIPE